jgi:uncharacterized protein (DUF58 family)
MMRLSYRLYLLATTASYRLPRRLTKAGLLAATGMILTGAIGSDVDQSMAFESFALLFCLLLVALCWAPFFRGQFAAERVLPRLATVDQPFRYRIQVRNKSARCYRDLEVLDDLADPRPSVDECVRLMHPVQRMRAFRLSRAAHAPLDFRQARAKPAELAPMAARSTAQADIELLPIRRGPLRFTGVTVARRDPLGLVRSFVRVPLPGTVLVLPKRYPIPALALPGARNYQLGGVALASSVGESEEFSALRDYRPGDPFRRIHWRSWARAGRPIVKEYQDEFFVRHGLVLDTFVDQAEAESFEEAVSVAASFACTLETQESLLDLLFVGCQAFCFTSGRGLGESAQVLEILASVRPTPNQRLHTLHELVLRHTTGLSGCICVLLDWDTAREEMVRQLRAHGLPVLVLIVVSPAKEKAIRQASPIDGFPDVHLLRLGKVAEDLQALTWSPA